MIALFLSALVSQGMATQKYHHNNSDSVKNCLRWQTQQAPERQTGKKCDYGHQHSGNIQKILNNNFIVKKPNNDLIGKLYTPETSRVTKGKRQFPELNNRTSAELGRVPDQIQQKTGKKRQHTIDKEIKNAQKNVDIAFRYAGQRPTTMTLQERINQGVFPARSTAQQKSAGVAGALKAWKNAPQEVVKPQRKMVPVTQTSETTHQRIFG